MLRALLCELEGVLVNTTAMRRDAMARAVASLGGTLPDEWRSVITDPPAVPADAAIAAAAADLAADDTTADLLGVAASRVFLEDASLKGVTLTDGAANFVKDAASQVRLGIVTRARRREAELLLSLTPFGDAFAFVVAEEDAGFPKPHPAPYEQALVRLRLPPGGRSDVLALEHGALGIASAGAAGLRCVAVGPFEQMAGVSPAAAIPALTVSSLAALARAAAAPVPGVVV
ncbi:MAG TPA: HAD family hydrolase [Gemmatimonadaceae bacterium]|nr:HAD family hydrolase [Gemmatimonadaceae bacterium]